MNAPRVRLDLRPLQQVRQRIRTGAAIEEMYTSWGRRTLAFWRDQFRRNRGGGGDWPPLKPETIKRTPKRLGILYVTGAIFNALRPGAPGNVFQRVRTGIAVGIGGGKHPDTSLSIGDLAMIHHNGGGNVPKRTIFYPPDPPLKEQFEADARRMAERIMREAGSAK
jgi:hypothetical protein